MMRPIEIESLAAVGVPASIGPAPQLQWIKIVQLVVDDSYQRPLASQGSRKNVRAIAEAFDWRKFAPVIVSPIAGGLYAIVDGQHRVTAAALCGITEVPCNVVLADRSEQARAFDAINGSITRIKPLNTFRARLVAGDPEAQRIHAVATAAGVEIMPYQASSKALRPRQTLAIETIAVCVRNFGDEVARLSLASIVHSAGDRPGHLRSIVIAALCTVLADRKDWLRHAELETAIAGIDLVEAESQARIEAIIDPGSRTQAWLQAAIAAHL